MAGILMAGSPVNRVLFLEHGSESLGSQVRCHIHCICSQCAAKASGLTVRVVVRCLLLFAVQDTDTNMECSPQKTIASITKTPVSDNTSNKGSPDVIVYATEDSVRRQLYQFPGRKPQYVDVIAKDMSTL